MFFFITLSGAGGAAANTEAPSARQSHLFDRGREGGMEGGEREERGRGGRRMRTRPEQAGGGEEEEAE